MNQDQPLISALYGVESYNLYNLEKPITHIALLAAKYTEYIKSIQPKGPYFIGGWSLGGTLSYEIACQLKDNGDTVLGVYLIDTPGLGPEVWKKLQAMFTSRNFIALLKEMEVPNEYIKRLVKLQLIESKLLSTYSLSVLDEVEVVLLNAMNRQTSKDKALDNTHKKLELLTHLPNNGWDPYAQNLTVHEFDADHQSIMLDTNHLKRVVKIIEADMSRKITAHLEPKPSGKKG
jgi:thioesterase domain-containing protein